MQFVQQIPLLQREPIDKKMRERQERASMRNFGTPVESLRMEVLPSKAHLVRFLGSCHAPNDDIVQVS